MDWHCHTPECIVAFCSRNGIALLTYLSEMDKKLARICDRIVGKTIQRFGQETAHNPLRLECDQRLATRRGVYLELPTRMNERCLCLGGQINSEQIGLELKQTGNINHHVEIVGDFLRHFTCRFDDRAMAGEALSQAVKSSTHHIAGIPPFVAFDQT